MESQRERSSALACRPRRMPGDWGRGKRGAGWRPYTVRCRSASSGTQHCWYAALPCSILDGVGGRARYVLMCNPHERCSFSDPIICLTLQSEYDTIHSLGRENRPRAGRIATRRPARPRGDPSLEGLRGSLAARRCPRTCLLRQLVAATGASAPGHAAGHRRGPSREPGRLAAPGGSGLARDASAAHVSVRRRAAPERCRGQPERRRH
jgi:hypothetical protein